MKELLPTPDASPESIQKSIESTLKRLNIDCLDLYYQHRIDPKVEPEIVAEEMQKLIDEGLIKFIQTTESTLTKTASAIQMKVMT